MSEVYSFVPNTKSEIFTKFINDFTLNNEDYELKLKEFFKESLLGKRSKKFLHLKGDGSNGKSVLLQLLVKLIGNNCVDVDDIDDPMILIDKRIVVLYENDNDIDSVLIKRITGGDSFYDGKKDYHFNGGLIYVSNNDLKDKVIIDRCILIPCLMNAVKNPVKHNERLLDPYLFDKLNTPNVLSAMLNWVLA